MAPLDATPQPGIFAKSRAAAAAAGWGFRHVASTGSTNADLADEARAGDRTIAVLTADHQTAGRGRLDRRWEDDGARQLMVSFRLPVEGDPTWFAGAVASAARRAVVALGAPAAFKWPNDLVLETDGVVGKLAGVLAEFVAGEPSVVVVGIGLNVGPPGVDGAASLDEVGLDVDRDTVLAAMIDALPALLTDPAAVRADLTEHSATVGRRVRVERPDGDLVGRATAIDADGRLEVEVGGETAVVSVGDVIHLRAAD